MAGQHSLKEDYPESSQNQDNEVPVMSSVRMSSILIVDDEPGIRNSLKKGLKDHFGLIEVTDNVETADELNQRCHFDLIISDIRLPGRSGVEWVTQLREQGHMTPVIFMTAYADLATAIEALRAGAVDFMMKPFRVDQMLAAIKRGLERQTMRRENYLLKRQIDKYIDSTGMVGRCDLFKSLCDTVKRVAPTNSTVMIEGESGTGKELVARAIHEGSRRKGSFVPVNCGGFTAEFLESELFGHVKGAFTGAAQAREGLFAYADGGTLFLDEIGEMPMSMQTHLLRALEERTVRPVGSNREVPVDVRVLTATNRNLLSRVENGTFRRDLFYRLNVLTIRIPSLRERKEDIAILVRHFASSLAAEMGISPRDVSDEEIARLASYEWPGNVRELKNVIERSLLLNITPSRCISGAESWQPPADEVENEDEDDLTLESVEKRHILKVLEMNNGNKSAAARALGLSRKTLERKTRAWAANDS
jgi:DNA-binding NtrC family response regulator